jgi:hypothetical protein
VELRIRQAVKEEHKTVLETQHWKARVRGTVVSPAPLPLSDLSNAFTFVGESGKVYRAHVSTSHDEPAAFTFRDVRVPLGR